MKNITYLLGAGASYNACPIWKEQGEKMVEMSLEYQNKHDFDNFQNPYDERNENFILWEIGYFGKKAMEFNTIDTYAKKLLLNRSTDELDRLKFAVSMFFTLWQLSTDLKIRNKERYKDVIDRRYIDLLAKLLENKGESNPTIPSNINVVTWNYDLQFEFAYKSFCNNDRSWRDIKNTLKFTTHYKDSQQICHLNGYHGFYLGGRGETDLLDRGKGSLNEILRVEAFTISSIFNGNIHFYDHINYAWENNDLSTSLRRRAKNIFSKTDILIIIGYSFPPFNKEIDKELFNVLKKDNLEIVYQDPNLDENFLDLLIDTSKIKVSYLKDRNDHFHFPYF